MSDEFVVLIGKRKEISDWNLGGQASDKATMHDERRSSPKLVN